MGVAMALADVQERLSEQASAGPRPDGLGLAAFTVHALIGLYLLFGWLVPYAIELAFYMVVLPAVALQWLVNRGSCVLNNIETWLRYGNWRDPRNPEEGGFVVMLGYWLLRRRPSRATADALSYGSVVTLWLFAFAHLSSLPS